MKTLIATVFFLLATGACGFATFAFVETGSPLQAALAACNAAFAAYWVAMAHGGPR